MPAEQVFKLLDNYPYLFIDKRRSNHPYRLTIEHLQQLITFDELLQAYVIMWWPSRVYSLHAYFNNTVDPELRAHRLTQLVDALGQRHVVVHCQLTANDLINPATSNMLMPTILNDLLCTPEHLPHECLDMLYARGLRRFPWRSARWLFINRGNRLLTVTTLPQVCNFVVDSQSWRLWEHLLTAGMHLSDTDIEELDFQRLWPVLQLAEPKFYFGQNITKFRGYTIADLEKYAGKHWTVRPVGQNCNDTVARMRAYGVPLEDMLANPYIDARKYVAALRADNKRCARAVSICCEPHEYVRWDIGQELLACKQIMAKYDHLAGGIKRAMVGCYWWQHPFRADHEAADVFALIVMLCDEFIALDELFFAPPTIKNNQLAHSASGALSFACLTSYARLMTSRWNSIAVRS